MCRQADFKLAASLNRVCLQIIGLWTEGSKGEVTSGTHLPAYLLFLLTIYFLAIPEVWSLVRVRHDLMLVVDNLQFSASLTSAIVKCVLLWQKRNEISLILGIVRRDYEKIKEADDRRTMLRFARLTRVITIGSYCVLFPMIGVLTILPCFGLTVRYVTNLTDPARHFLPVQSHFPYDLGRRRNFIATYALQTVSILVATVYFAGIDCFVVFTILHACGQLENLSRRLRRLGESDDFMRDVAICVDEHVRLIRFTNIIDNTTNMMLLVQLCNFTVLFCFLGLHFVVLIKDGTDLPITRLVWLGGAISIALLQMLAYCLIGEILLSHCERVYNATCNCVWYTLKPQEARMITLILIRTRPPLCVTAGRIFPLSVTMFCNILKTSVSYLSVLLAYF